MSWPTTPSGVYIEDNKVTPMALVAHTSAINLWTEGLTASE